MNSPSRFDVSGAAPSENFFDYLPLSMRLWLAFRAGVTRRLDLLPISGSCVRAAFQDFQNRA